MQAINHIATALILKKKFPAAPLFGLILATEAVELVWVVLNLIGVEHTEISAQMASVADVHLVHMPFSHSVLSGVVLGLLAGIWVLWRGGRAAGAVALAIGLAVVSHLVLDVVVHARDIPLAPFMDSAKIGSGLYANLPMVALGVETLWGVLCWWIYRGSWTLLLLILVMGAGSVPFYSAAINTGEAALGGQSMAFVLMILAQICVTSLLVWLLARRV